MHSEANNEIVHDYPKNLQKGMGMQNQLHSLKYVTYQALKNIKYKIKTGRLSL